MGAEVALLWTSNSWRSASGPAALHVHSGRPLAHVLPASSAITRTTSISDKYSWIPLINHENPTRISVFKIAPSGNGKKRTDLMFWAVSIIHVHMKSGPLHWVILLMDDDKKKKVIDFLSPGVQFSQESLDLSERGIPGNTVLGGGAYPLNQLLHYYLCCV